MRGAIARRRRGGCRARDRGSVRAVASPRMRPPKDRDFIETVEGLFFCVVGYVHPPGRYAAYLKYTPASAGKWARGDVAYRRELPYYHVRHVRRTLEWLEAEHPRYLWTDPTTGLRFSHVPADAVARYYVPERRLAEIVADPGGRARARDPGPGDAPGRRVRPAPRCLRRLGVHPPRSPQPGVLGHRSPGVRSRERPAAPGGDRRPRGRRSGAAARRPAGAVARRHGGPLRARRGVGGGPRGAALALPALPRTLRLPPSDARGPRDPRSLRRPPLRAPRARGRGGARDRCGRGHVPPGRVPGRGRALARGGAGAARGDRGLRGPVLERRGGGRADPRHRPSRGGARGRATPRGRARASCPTAGRSASPVPRARRHRGSESATWRSAADGWISTSLVRSGCRPPCRSGPPLRQSCRRAAQRSRSR